MTTTYLAQAFDAGHNWLDTDSRGEGFPTEITGAGELLTFVNETSTGVLHDFDGDTHTTRPIAYWLIAVGGIVREVYVTSWGSSCNTKIPTQGPGCRQPTPVPAAS